GEGYASWESGSGAVPARTPMKPSGWDVEFGGRYWHSTGSFQKDLPAAAASAASLVSRLTYDDVTANTGEFFGRVDTPWNFFVKGFIGGGRISGGHMNDEDWGIGANAIYSNTLSDLDASSINYATIDGGYSFLKGPGYNVGALLGYNYLYEQMAASTCTQIASPASGICAPPIMGLPVITETDRWNSVRIGLAADVWLTNSLKLSADAAYLPYVKFTGTDNHWLRDLVISESGNGRGVQ